MIRALSIISILFSVLGFVLSTNAYSGGYESAIVNKIVDGDTINVLYHNKIENLRLIGIDAPESSLNKKAYKDAKRTQNDISVIIDQGEKSKNYLKTLIKPEDKVTLEFDIQPKDKYNRLLAYVYLPNGEMLNEKMVMEGYATPMTVPPNIKYQDRFLKASKIARENNKGLWQTASSSSQIKFNNANNVVFNTNSLIYHSPNCKWAKKCTKNCIVTTKADAIKRGGRPCKVCGGN